MNMRPRPWAGLGAAPEILGSCRIDFSTSARVVRKAPGSWCVTVGSWRSSAADEEVACGSSQAEAMRTMRDLCVDGPDRRPAAGASRPSGLSGTESHHEFQATRAWSDAQAAVGQVIDRTGRGDCDEAMGAYGDMMMAYGRHQAHAEYAAGVSGSQRDSRRNAVGTAVRSINRCRSQAWRAPRGGRRAPW